VLLSQLGVCSVPYTVPDTAPHTDPGGTTGSRSLPTLLLIGTAPVVVAMSAAASKITQVQHPCIVFHLQHKTAGATVEKIFHNNAAERRLPLPMGPAYLCDNDDWNHEAGCCQKKKVWGSKHLPGVVLMGNLVMTHAQPPRELHEPGKLQRTSPLCRTFPGGRCSSWARSDGCYWLTLFREPISRLVSSYSYCRSQTQLDGYRDPLCATSVLWAGNATIEQWAEHIGNTLMRELLLHPSLSPLPLPGLELGGHLGLWSTHRRILNGSDDPRTARGREALQRVAERLNHDGSGDTEALYDTYGILDDLKETMLRFDRAIPLHRPWMKQMLYFRDTHNSNKTFEQQVLRQARESPVVRAALAGDLILYHGIIKPRFLSEKHHKHLPTASAPLSAANSTTAVELIVTQLLSESTVADSGPSDVPSGAASRTSSSVPLPATDIRANVRAFIRSVCRLPQATSYEARGPRGCLERPVDQIDACVAQLEARRTWPAKQALAQAMGRFSARGHAVLFVGDSTLRNKWAAITHMAPLADSGCQENGTGVCYVPTQDPQNVSKLPTAICPLASIQRLQNVTFDAVVFNYGLHYIRCFDHKCRPKCLEDYQEALEECMHVLSATFKSSKMVYKATNYICSQKWDGSFAAYAKQMEFAEEASEYTFQWGSVGSMTLNVAEHEVVRAKAASVAGGWELIGTRTREHCECTGDRDGRHFLPLIPDFLVRLSERIWGPHTPT